jgi:hypothetical protein
VQTQKNRKSIAGYDFSPLEPPHTPSAYSEDSSSSSFASSEYGRKNYRAVPMTPLIVPGKEASPLFTWGDISATPMILDGQRTEVPSSSAATSARREPSENYLLERVSGISERDMQFEIKPVSTRESIARVMGSTRKRQYPNMSASPLVTPVMILDAGKKRRASKGETMLTPAAQALADRLRAASSNRGPATPFGGSIEQGYR